MDDGAWKDGLGQDPYADILERAKRSEEREREAEARRNAPLPFLWLGEIEPVLEARDFVQGVLVEGSAAVIYGDSNAGKTFFVTDLALHVAAGLDWNGRRVQQGGVVYVAMEGGNGFRNRVYAWRERHARDDRGLPFVAIPAGLNLLDADADTPRLIAAIKAAAVHMGQPVKLVVLDTLSRAMAGGNENASEDMGALVRNMDLIRAETGACILFVHHSGKDAAKGARGHSLLRAAVDTEIEVKADDDTGARTATIVKQREMAKGDSFSFRLDRVVLGQNQRGKDVTTCTVGAAEQPRASASGHDLKEDERHWLRDVKAYFDDPTRGHRGVIPCPGSTPVWAVTRDEMRAWLVDRGRIGVTGNVTPGAPISQNDRQTCSRYLNRLRNKGKIGIFKDWIWLSQPPDVTA